MITVIIPALNEEKTVGSVVKIANNSKLVTEVLVVDDKSIDATVEEARLAGATVITSTKLGKGASMKDGALVAKNEILVFLDADITTYPENIIDLLGQPILKDEADFVKSFFTRQAGRVTELVAKPLLSILYPDFPTFRQPLSGMIACKKSYFLNTVLEEGYGIDIGLLIDMHVMGARIQEVNIGDIENRMHPLDKLGKMSREVSRTILKKSKNIDFKNFETLEDIHIIRQQMDFAIRENLMSLNKIAMFDMDNTILRESFIQTAAEKFGFKKELFDIITNYNSSFIRTKRIASLLQGKSIGELIELVDNIKTAKNIENTVVKLKKNGFIVGIISDSYDCITNHLKNKFGFDFTLANELEFSQSICTGEVKIPSLFLVGPTSLCGHEYCKLNALIQIASSYSVELINSLVVGDGINDICCIKKAGVGISFCSTNKMVDVVADHVIKKPDFKEILQFLG